jgi:hypothetical protein
MATQPDWQQLASTNRSIAAIQHGRGSSDYTPSLIDDDEDPKPTKAHEVVVYEFGMRWKCPRDEDPDRYNARLRLLMRDCAGLAPTLMRKAGDRVSNDTTRFSINALPSSAEIHIAAEAIMAERAAKQMAAEREAFRPQPGATHLGDKEAAYARGNLDALRNGMRLMMTSKGDSFRLGDIGERRGIRDNGSAIEPWFHHSADGDGIPSGWYCLKPDASVLADCYRQSRATFRMDGCRILAA